MGVSRCTPCPCCGYLTLSGPPGSFEICDVRWWEDDVVQLKYPGSRGGANQPALVEAQATFQAHGSSDLRLSSHTRQPRPSDALDSGWRLLDTSRTTTRRRFLRRRCQMTSPRCIGGVRPTGDAKTSKNDVVEFRIETHLAGRSRGEQRDVHSAAERHRPPRLGLAGYDGDLAELPDQSDHVISSRSVRSLSQATPARSKSC